jgi:flavin-dependent dehydrogenase
LKTDAEQARPFLSKGKAMYDVIVVGAGPAGCIAAKRCAEKGLKTLLIERRLLPRDKVCSGMIVGRLARAMVEEGFSKLPQEVVLETLPGLTLWVPEAGQNTIATSVAITWRKDLDFWMAQKALEKGVEVWDRSFVKGLASDGRTCSVMVKKRGVAQELSARFVVGADGIDSTIRQSLFPELHATYTVAYRECHAGSLNLEQRNGYAVFPSAGYRPNFWILPKGDCFTIEGGLRTLRKEIGHILTPCGFQGGKPLWKDGCLSRVQIAGHPFPDAETLARGNVLLAGDSARLKVPVSGEGIGTALKSGILAADSIVESLASGKPVFDLYSKGLRPLLASLHAFSLDLEQIKTGARKGPQALLDELTVAFERTIEATGL